MQLARVIGTVVATQKHRKFEGAKLLLVQPLNVDDTPRGTPLLAIDDVGAGVNEIVLVVLEGRAAGEALGRKGISAMVVGGMGNIWGAIAGGLIIGLVETLSIQFFGADFVDMSVYGLLLFILIVRPTGLMGTRES